MQKKQLPSFFFGVATSSHQVEGNNQHNDWWYYEQSGRLREASGIACDGYNRYEEDFDLLQKLGHNAHRFSLEWSRLEPSEGQWDEEAFNHYKKLLDALRSRGMEPFVTLNHFTLPQWFAQKGGWEKKENIDYFVRYVERVLEAFAHNVRFWVTINEPMVYVYHGYFEGIWPPFKMSFPLALKVTRNLLYAHIHAYQKIHAFFQKKNLGEVQVSIAKHMIWFTPHRRASWTDKLAIFFRHWFFNRLFLEALKTGFLFYPTLYCETLPAKGTLDFVGLNYYFREEVRYSGLTGTALMGTKIVREDCEKNQLGWEVSPEGLGWLLSFLKKYDLPIFILENGICTLEDSQRARFIERHLEQVRLALKFGVRVEGYFYWSFMDNFEWAEGYGPRFGIIRISYDSQNRKILPSAQVLTEQCRKILNNP